MLSSSCGGSEAGSPSPSEASSSGLTIAGVLQPSTRRLKPAWTSPVWDFLHYAKTRNLQNVMNVQS